ncbi:Bile acid sodium symporter [Geobacillus stearothermophilus]|uniref:Bile acid sodium symporter n=1 Tax=Geobacillus stearothermophilus TaxID=1422 RepID=A0A150MPJ6_GEOSE|nr:Bile acid sodium symporter [Geobacillus stearothermophilus]KYD26302.1 hypothetical protein B4109_1638 [Geobacillus stearothermophilus]
MLCMSYFPPPVSVPVVLGMLFQQVLASMYHRLLDKTYHLSSGRQASFVESAR